jgi:purine-binding chemotaxis protein CheW
MRRVKEGMYVCCRVGGKLVGIDLDCVQEINRLVDPTPVPLMPPHVRGVVNLRGNLVTVLDLECIIRGERAAVGPRSRTVVLELGQQTCGLLVDEVGDVVDIEDLACESLSGLIAAEERRWYTGLVQLPDQLLLLLDIAAVAQRGSGAVEVVAR